jgi:tellurite resistance protein TehA-like permease
MSGDGTNLNDVASGPAEISAAEMMRRAIRGCVPASFAVTMAAGIVSAALRVAGFSIFAEILLAITAASFAVAVVGSLARLALFRRDLRADLADPARAFSAFAFVAACDVLGSELATIGHRRVAAALAVVALLAWTALTVAVPGRLVTAIRPFTLVSVGGNWYLWAVGTQSLAIALTSAGRGGQAARAAVLAAWITGLIIYLAVTGLILARLRLVGLAKTDATAPYWVTMGAASISILAAAGLLAPAWSPSGAARTAMIWVAVILWVLASGLTVPLAARSAWRHLAWHEALRYRLDLWMIIFPVGMYATASMHLGTTADLPVLRAIGRVAVWPAAAGWALVFAAMMADPFVRAVQNRTRTGSQS